MRLALVTAFTAVAFGLSAASCGAAKTCTPQSCSTGCCSETGECLSGGENSACGSGGNACVNCAATAQTCGNKVCITTGTGGGGGGSSTGGGGGSTSGGGGGSTSGGGGGSATGGGGGSTSDAGCPRALAPADRTRYLVASHPFPADGGSRDNLFEVFELSATGTLSPTGKTFRMGRANDATSTILFTPDGVVGIAPQEQGSLGVFTLDATGTPTVVHAAFTSGFSPGKLLMLPSGDSFLATDFNTENNGGGLYQVDIGCDGTLGNVRKVLPGNNAAAAVFLPNQELLAVASRDLSGSPAMQDVHLVERTASGPVVRASTTGFPDRDAIPPTLTVSADGRWLVAPDNGFLAGDRVAVFERQGTTLTARQLLTASSPLVVAFSPFGTTGLLITSDGADHFRRFAFDGTSFSVATIPMSYAHGRPQLPGTPAMLDRGALTGRLFVPELLAVRQLQFERDGGITDVAKTSAGGTGSGQILGTLGVQP